FYGDWYIQICQNLWNAIDRDKLTRRDGVGLKEHLRSKGIRELGNLNPKNTTPNSFEEHIKEVEANFWGRRFAVYSQWKVDWWNAYLKRGYYRMLTGFVSRGTY